VAKKIIPLRPAGSPTPTCSQSLSLMTLTAFIFHMKINVTQILLHRLDEAKLHNGKSHDFHSPAKLLEWPDYAEEDMDEACSMHVKKV